MSITTQTRFVIANDATSQDKMAALSVQRELKARFGFARLQIVHENAVKDAENVIVFGEFRRVRFVRKLLNSAHLKPSGHSEGYELAISKHWTLVAGHDVMGTFYGAQTLCQLLDGHKGQPFVTGAQIDDYPSLRWRGAHLFVGNQALPFHKKLIANIFARYKLNNLVLQCEQAKWDTLGSTAPNWAMSKHDLKTEITFAKLHFMTVTPLIESAGHMGWLLNDPKYRPWAEDPQTPYALCPIDPKATQFLERLYDEVLDTFHSSNLHIGGDEVTLRGRYPWRSQSKYPTVAGAYIAQITPLHDYLARKGVGTMLWTDMLLASGEASEHSAPTLQQAQKMRALLPHDITLIDWHYGVRGDFSSPQLFQKSGFHKVIGATWYEPNNIAMFSHALSQNRRSGLLQTTWAGYNSSEANLKSSPEQFAAFVWAAEESWNGGQYQGRRLPYDPNKIFKASYGLRLNK